MNVQNAVKRAGAANTDILTFEEDECVIDLTILLPIAQAYPELEIADTGTTHYDNCGITMYFAWYSPAGSDTLAPTKSENYALPSYVAHDIREENEDGNFCTGD